MSRNPEVALTLKARDEASRPIARVLQGTERQARDAERATQRLSQMTEAANKRMAGLASAREQLGIRSERVIQREILLTEAAYKRLAGSGTLSAKEQSRAYDAMRDKVAGLRREMAGVSQLQRGMVAGAKALTAGAAAAVAGGAVLASPMRRVANYDMRLAQMTNTAFNDTEVNGRKLSAEEQLDARRKGKKRLEAYIRAASDEGGTRDDNLAALDKLIARGIFSPQEAGQLLPMISKAATAAGSSAEEMTGVVMAAVQNAKIPVEQIPKALGMALKAGQMGGFELKDMATWLPKMLAMGGLSGLRGTDGLASILAASQLAVTAAGSTDDAGNNVVNFLQKITASDTANDLKKVSARTLGSKQKGEAGVDLYGTLAQARQQGVDPVEAFTRLVRKIAESDKEFTRLQRMAGDAKDDKEKSAMYGSMADILQARGVGKTIQDRQAMLALLPMLFDPEAYKNMKAGILGGGEQDVEINQRFIKEQAGFKFQQAENLKEQGQYDSIGKFNNAVGDVVGKLADYGARYPALTASLVGATTAATALAAAAGAAAIPMLLMGGGKGGAVSTVAKPLANIAARAAPAVASTVAGMGVGAVAPLAFAGTMATIASSITDEDRKNATRRQTASRFGKDLVARNAPSTAAPVPQGDMSQPVNRAASKLDAAAAKIQQAASQPIPVKVTVDVQHGNIVAAVNAANAQTARRF